MSYFIYHLLLLLCVSMHACNSRHLGVFDKESGKEFHLADKMPEANMAESVGRNFKASNIEQEESNVLSDEEKMHKGIGTKVHNSQEKTKKEGWKTHASPSVESKQQDSKEAVNSKDNDVTEDVVVMDYAQPHRKPPIHNLQP